MTDDRQNKESPQPSKKSSDVTTDGANCEESEKQCLAACYAFLSDLHHYQLKQLTHEWKTQKYGNKKTLLARCFLHMQKQGIQHAANMPRFFQDGSIKDMCRIFCAKNATKKNWEDPPPEKALKEVLDNAKIVARVRNQKARESTPSKRSTEQKATTNRASPSSSQQPPFRRADNERDSDLADERPKKKARNDTRENSSEQRMRQPMFASDVEKGQTVEESVKLSNPTKNPKPDQKVDVGMSQFVRVMLLLRDDELCREGLAASMLRLDREELDVKDSLDDFWTTDVEREFNSVNFRPTESFSTVFPNIDVLDPGPHRDASWLQNIVCNTRKPFSTYYDLYRRSGQNDPNMFRKIIEDCEQRDRQKGRKFDDEFESLFGDIDETDTTSRKLSAMGKRCLLTFHIVDVPQLKSDTSTLFHFMLKISSRVTDDGGVEACGREAGIAGHDTKPEKKEKRRRHSTDSACKSGSAIQGLIDAYSKNSESREKRAKEKDEAAQRSIDIQSAQSQEMMHHNKMMSVLEELSKVGKLLEEAKARGPSDLSVTLLQKHYDRVLKKYNRMLDLEGSDDDGEGATRNNAASGSAGTSANHW